MTREFLADIEAQAIALQQEIEAYQQGFDPSPSAISARRTRVLQGDFTFFAYTYFPHHIRGTPSQFQKHFCDRFPQLLTQKQGCIEWWIAPRGEAKTSLLTKIGSVWVAIQNLNPNFKLDYVVLLGAETTFPAKLIEVVKAELCYNALLRLDFPEACGPGHMWRVGEIITPTGVKFESFGAEQAIRGTFHGASRPQLILGDDLITDKEAKSPTERETRWNWYIRAVSYLGPPEGTVKALNVATVLHGDDPVSRAKRTVGHTVHHFKAIVHFPERMDLWEKCEQMMRNQDGRAIEVAAKKDQVLTQELYPSYQFYQKNRKAMDRGAEVSWPEVRPLYWLMRQRVNNPRAFLSEMQGESRNEENRIFTEWQTWSTHPSPQWRYFGACDPSMGRGESSDPSALLVGGYDVLTRKLYVIEASIKRRVPSKLCADLIALQTQYSCAGWAFENNNAYEHMRTSFIQTALAQGISLPLIGVTATVPIEVRIDSLEPFICGLDPRMVFNPKLSALIEQLDSWPEPQTHHHYDGLVALHLLWMMAVSRSSGIPRVESTKRPGFVDFTGY